MFKVVRNNVESQPKTYPSVKCPTPPWINSFPSKTDSLVIQQVKEFNCGLECSLKNGLKDWEKFMKLLEDFKEVFLGLLESQLLYCWKQGLDSYFWKILYYNNIQYLKHKINVTPTSSASKEKADELILDGIEFYQKLYTLIYDRYLKEPKEKLFTVAKVIAQKMLISMGNLHRYKALISGDGNFELAAVYYMKAHKILPANGVPFNQMAIISLYNVSLFCMLVFYF